MAAWRSGGIPPLPFKSARPAAVAPNRSLSAGILPRCLSTQKECLFPFPKYKFSIKIQTAKEVSCFYLQFQYHRQQQNYLEHFLFGQKISFFRRLQKCSCLAVFQILLKQRHYFYVFRNLKSNILVIFYDFFQRKRRKITNFFKFQKFPERQALQIFINNPSR